MGVPCAADRLIHRLGRVLGGPAARAACGGDLSLLWLPRAVLRATKATGVVGDGNSQGIPQASLWVTPRFRSIQLSRGILRYRNP
jgi:hypothetical protein